MWPFGKRIESVFRAFYFFAAKALIINYENLVRGKIEFLRGQEFITYIIYDYANGKTRCHEGSWNSCDKRNERTLRPHDTSHPS